MTESSRIEEELISAFSTTPGSDDAFIKQCSSLCKTYNVAPLDLYFKWESLVISSSTAGARIINKGTAGAIRDLLQSELNKIKANQKRAELNARMSRGRGLGLSGLAGRSSRFPEVGMVKPMLGDAFASTSLNGNRMAGPSKVAFRSFGDEESKDRRSYRYMYEKTSERSDALDERIDEFGALVREHYEISDLGDPSSSTDEDVVVIGRITLDAESSSSGSVKLNEASLCLESSRMMGSGARVPLKFDSNVKLRASVKGLGSVGLFPGAIVALKGKNGGAGWFSVSEILTLPPLKPSHTNPDNTKLEAIDTSFSMVIASGPFSPNADLLYKPWKSLLKTLKLQKPAVVLLIGPFVDSNHPKLKSGDIDESPSEILFANFTENLRDFLEISPDSLILIVPSTQDAISEHIAFPQGLSNCSKRIKLLSNPCQFSLNGVTFAVSSVDVLFHLRKEELVKYVEEIDPIAPSAGDAVTDTMTNTCRHLLQQRSFYPLFPVPLDLSHEVNLDVSHSDGLDLCPQETMGYAPDVLIVPSRLKHFSKIVDDTVAVNPSYITKSIFASLSYIGHGDGPAKSRIKVDVGRMPEQ
ncbi:hypothetical protein HETIRDRAFT_317937 [Heterobasidion irregulare TC 32-1]|uniref:DNA polymerase alpha subunit B n=1 Tax=Heterobasidion irregulare (strain TC 32-1) TaxID=747525 RepID=W4K8Y0_HETIT|nr:uncharacterized protein HETIRDRAFT_317937 [Heterobasidion irregulare TC 32-1]ETW81536.1 hypothetical protein HETIRDRAFT_317937 [Heterobasidion irregulare TC 32-1]